ncbi:MFS transporter [Allomesorhizobium alhagi]|uniref:MFS transporter n=1 Tax=Allomesorhizobium alhagi TaxID=475067 RepID=UPI00059046E8|nr:MFS transporter [Mesorhizobium alhagi]
MRSPCEAHEGAVPQTAARPEDGTFCPRERRRYVLVAAILASSLGFIDGSVVAIAIPAMRSDLGASLIEAQWISNAYALTLSALILAGGAAGDKFGLRRTLIVGIALFIGASMVCAVAPDALFLIVARAVQGVGAAIMVPGSLAIIAKAYPKKERGRAIGIWAAASALTTALGPVIGGVLLSSFEDSVWRWIFAVNLPLGGLAIYFLAAKVPADAPGETRTLDLGGAALATVSLGALAYGFTVFGTASLLHSAAWVAAGFVVLAAFLVWERRQKEPMVDLGLFASRSFSGANVSTFFLYFALSAILFYLPMLLIAGWGLSEAATGFIFLPLSLAIALLSGPVGKASDSIGPRLPIVAGSLVVAAAFAGLALLTGGGIHSFWFGIFPLMALMGLGMALVVSPLSTAIMTAVEDSETGSASGINNAVARMAGLFAVAAMGGVAALRYASLLGETAGVVPSFGEEPASALPADAESIRLAASDAAFAAVSWVTAALCVLSALTAWMTVPGSGRTESAEDAANPASAE